MSVDDTLLVRELGDRVALVDLSAFLQVTGRWEACARGALLRQRARGEASFPEDVDAQDVFDQAVMRWGWRTSEEVSEGLAALGIDLDDLGERAHEEASLTRLCRELAKRARTDGDRRVRAQLFFDADLALKLEVHRLGSLQRFAANRDAAALARVTEEERLEARRALTSSARIPSWSHLLAQHALSEDDVASIVDALARARRITVPLLSRMEASFFDTSPLVAPSPSLAADLDWGKTTKAPGENRVAALDEAFRVARALSRELGIEEVVAAGVLGGDPGVHVALAYRPSPWSSLSGSGKGTSKEAAFVGAVFEEAEKLCQERHRVEHPIRGSFRALSRDHRVLRPSSFARAVDGEDDDDVLLDWCRVPDLRGGSALLPMALVSFERREGDPPCAPLRPRGGMDTNGLASGLSLAEATAHGLAEVIERHARRLADVVTRNPGALPDLDDWRYRFVDPGSLPASCRALVRVFGEAGLQVRIMDCTSEARIATFEVRVFPFEPLVGMTGDYSAGAGCHPNAEVAAHRALAEAAQAYVGARAEAEGRVRVAPQSLGRTHRPRPLTRGDACWAKDHVPLRSFASTPSYVRADVADDVGLMVAGLERAGFEHVLVEDMSRPELAPLRVVRVLVPDAEGINAMHTGPRARVLALADLSRSAVLAPPRSPGV